MIGIKQHGDHCTIDVHVTPKAKQASIGGCHDSALRVSVTAPADKGKANKAVEKSIATIFGVAKSNVEVVRGSTSRRKTVAIAGVSEAEVRKRLDPLLCDDAGR
ncbi:hypothetical protein RMSM_04168 [Rhodopirellula maiorica SM1]|uniref:UPF0235 protein RMSM_04168 n=1 Tax=Rhodopirellula maiorica SM1 TaxID=1265738 RepID=M5RI96_9BACT|nr:DUF167 domain-containing protein [Rhodopirellula maiorica]EMI18906.1 hypothetical protein RMSM_04168 [Rhodopirellula maiorica SM1]